MTSCLSLMLVLDLGRQSLASWQRYTATQTLERLNLAGDRFAESIFETLIEWLLTNNALQSDSAASSATRSAIERRRAAAHSDGPLLEILAADLPHKAQLAQSLADATLRAEDFRKRADLMLQLPKSQRDPETVAGFAPALEAMVRSAMKLWRITLQTTSVDNPAFAHYAAVKHFGWTLRELAGRERGIIAASIASGRPIPDASVQQIIDFRAQMALLWQSLQDVVSEDTLIEPVLTHARTLYFENFRPFADSIREAGRTASYPITAAEWVTTTSPQLDSLLAIMKAASQASERVGHRLSTDALYDLVVQLTGIIVAVLLTALCFVVVIGRIVTPLRRVTTVVERLSAGELEIAIQDTGRHDEVGAVARALAAFRENAVTARELERTQQAQRIQSEHRHQAMERHIAVFEAGVHGSLTTLGSAATAMRATSASMSATAEQTRMQSSSGSAAAAQALASVEVVANATEELSACVSDIACRVEESAKIAGQAVSEADRTNATVQGMSEAAREIGAVVRLIGDIASQTDLLALNATIEAARAGDAGKGFAVVAAEVKSLARETAKATASIARQVAAMQAATSGAAEAILRIGGTIGAMNRITASIAAAISQQDTATQDIARNVGQAAVGTQHVASTIDGVNQAASDTGAAAGHVLAAAGELGTQAERLRADVTAFLGGIRAA